MGASSTASSSDAVDVFRVFSGVPLGFESLPFETTSFAAFASGSAVFEDGFFDVFDDAFGASSRACFDVFRVFSDTALGSAACLPFETSSFTAFESRSLGFARSFQSSSSSKEITGAAALPSASATCLSSVCASPARSPPTMSAPSDAGRFAGAAVTTVSRHEMLVLRPATLLASTAPSAAILAPERAFLRSR